MLLLTDVVRRSSIMVELVEVRGWCLLQLVTKLLVYAHYSEGHSPWFAVPSTLPLDNIFLQFRVCVKENAKKTTPLSQQ